jgi:putative addiction module antidote
MTVALKIRRIGDALAVVLPPDALQALNVGEGDVVHLIQPPVPVHGERPGFEAIMKMAGEGMNQYSNALRELAK